MFPGTLLITEKYVKLNKSKCFKEYLYICDK